MRAYAQLFPKRWPLRNPNRTKSIMSKHKVKHHRNSDTKKTVTSEPIKLNSKISDKSFGIVSYVCLKQKWGYSFS